MMDDDASNAFLMMLAAERGKITTPDPIRTNIYLDLYERLATEVRRLCKFDPPKLMLVGSASGLSAMVRHGSESWIVYDTFLGAIFSRLGELVDQRASLEEIEAYLTRLYVSRLLVGGRTRMSYALAISLAIQGISTEADESPDRASSSHLQYLEEAYVLAHELGHAVFAANTEIAGLLHMAYFEFCKAEASDVDERPRPSSKTMAESLADDVNREYVRRNGPLDDKILEDGKAQLTAHYLECLESNEVTDSEQIRTEPELSEEVVCDAFAAILVARVMSDGTAASTLEALVASFNASQKLRLIKQMDAQVAGHGIESTAIRDTTLRGSQLRQIFRAIYESGMTEMLFGFRASPADIVAMLEQIRDVNQRFYRSLFDQLLVGGFYVMADGLAERFSVAFEQGDATVYECWNIVTNFLGFGKTYDWKGDPVEST